VSFAVILVVRWPPSLPRSQGRWRRRTSKQGARPPQGDRPGRRRK